MKVIPFYHSLVSDWNHGNAHFLRGIASELMARGHGVEVFEPRDAWSRHQLLERKGPDATAAFAQCFPQLRSHKYDADLDLDAALDGADLVIVHEWNTSELLQCIGDQRARNRSFRLLFHDTHHRSVSAPEAMRRYDLSNYDGVLAFGAVIREIYRERNWAQPVWVWHEAADTRIFRPFAAGLEKDRDIASVGNWGDGERSAQLQEFLLEPVAALHARATVRGVRYPDHALAALARCGVRYEGWIANHAVPALFARHRVTVHIPRHFYATKLPGIPTIRPFEALACGIPLICSPWDNVESLFRLGTDHLIADTGFDITAPPDHEIYLARRNGTERSPAWHAEFQSATRTGHAP